MYAAMILSGPEANIIFINWVRQDGYIIVIYTPSDKYSCPVFLCGTVCSVTNMVCRLKGDGISETSFSKETYIDFMLTDECSSSSYLPRTPSPFQHANRKAFAMFVLLGRVANFGCEGNNNFQDGWRASHPRWEGASCCEEPTPQLHTSVDG